MRRTWCVLVLVLAVLAACGDDGERTPVALSDAVDAGEGTDVRVTGFVHHLGLILSGDVYEDLDVVSLCEVVVDRPEQGDVRAALLLCGGAVLELEQVEEEDFELRSDRDGESWSAREVTVDGTIRREDDDVWLEVDRVVAVDGRPTRPRAPFADAPIGREVELTVRAFQGPDEEVTLCDTFVEVEVGRHPFYDDPLFDPSGCAEPSARVTNPEKLGDVRFLPTAAPERGAYAPEMLVVVGVVEQSSAGSGFTVSEVIA